MKYDLHCHSLFSDGQLSPTELVSLAAKNDISHLALTDHDTLAGLEEAQLAAAQHSISLVNGIELSCTWNGQLLHIVGLGIEPDNDSLKSGVRENQQRRHIRADAMIEDFLSHGIDLSQELEVVLSGAVPTRPHFAQALINLGYAKDKQQAFKRFLVRGKPGYVSMVWPSLHEIGDWVSAANGVAVLAHPLRYKFTRTKLVRLIDEMKQAKIEGIEVSTSNTDLQQEDMLSKLAVQHDLLSSIGSDFHSLDQPWARLGNARPLAEHLQPVWSRL